MSNTVNCTVKRYKHYNGAWSSWSSTLYGGYAGASKYAVVLEILTGSPEAFSASTSITFNIPVVRQYRNGTALGTKTGNLNFDIFAADQTGLPGTVRGTGTLGSGSVAFNITDYEVHTLSYTISTKSLAANTKYYVYLSLSGTLTNSKHLSIGYNSDAGKNYSVSMAYVSTYAISYNSNGGSGTQTSGTKTHGKDFTLPSCTFTAPAAYNTACKITFKPNGGKCSDASKSANKKTTYSFGGWLLNNNSNSLYSAGSAYKTDAAATFYAKWNTSTGTGSITLPTPTYTGYNFGGWYNNDKLTGTAYSGGSTYTFSSDGTLYAKWNITQRTLTYDGNGGAPESQTQKLDYNISTTLAYKAPTRRGYTFLGWATSKSATVATYKSGSSISITADKTLYAVWQPLTFTINYNLGGGYAVDGAVYTKSVKYNESCTILKSSDVKKSGLDFSYWTTNSNGTSDSYNWTNWSGTWQFINGEKGIANSTLNLYPKWSASPFKISYKVYDKTYVATTNISNKESILGIKDVLSRLGITLNSYDRFNGWKINSTTYTDISKLWSAINTNATTTESPRKITITADISDRYNIVYYNAVNKQYRKLTPVRWKDPKWSTLKLQISNK